jgi:hypothetical protein
MKVIAYGSLVLSSLLVLLWPAAAYASIFAFDAPSGGAYFELKRYGLVIGILSYPWGYLVAIARILARRKSQAWWSKLTIGFLLTPFVQLALVFLLATALGR